MTKDLISVIVPVFNVERYLPKCLECISNQTYRKLEIILVDDGSTDLSGQICDEYAISDIRAKVIHQDNKGLWDARNAGQDIAQGEFLFFPDPDDYFHSDMIRQMHRAITSKDGFDIAIVGMKKTNCHFEDCDRLIKCEWTEQSSGDLFKNLLEFGYPYANIWNKLFRAHSLGKVRSRPFPIAQDLDFNIQAFIQVRSIICTESVFYYWYLHDSQISNKAKYYKIWPVIFYLNYSVLSSNKVSYESYDYILLEQLYRRIALLKSLSIKAEDKTSVFKMCREYYKKTIHDYLKEKRIPVKSKAASLVAIYFPFIGYCVLRFFEKHAECANKSIIYIFVRRFIDFCQGNWGSYSFFL